MYGTEGQRQLEEIELDWLPGYEGSRPVRVGNAAAKQFQLDVYGEVAGVAYATSMVTEQHRRSQLAAGARAGRVPRNGMGEAGRRHLGGPADRVGTSSSRR